MKLDIATAPKRNSFHWKQSQITWEDLLAWAEDPASVKEAGNYVLGAFRETTETHPGRKDPCTGLHRNKMAIVTRSALTLDIDHPGVGLLEKLLEVLAPYQGLIHTTYNSTPDFPRYRVILPTDRDMAPDEYHHAAASLMDRVGAHHFDPGSVQPERYMFKPSAQQPAWFESWTLEGDPIPVGELLADYDPDLTKLPLPRKAMVKRDPFAIDGVIGAFNRMYEIDAVIDEYDLPYESMGEDRWKLVGASSAAGMSLVAPGLVYSHHVNDPAYNQTASAFDLVRLHRFGILDEDLADTPLNKLPSFQMMLDLAAQDPRVLAEQVGLDFSQAMDDQFGSWKLQLRLSPRSGKLIDDIGNWDLIRENDPVFTLLCFNELTMSVESTADLPWRPLSQGGATFAGADRSSLCHYLEREYHIRPARTFVDELIDTTARSRFVNPVRDYLSELVWDGTPRVETALPGVRPTEYTRLVARKVLTAAVARMMDPGVKWDHALVLFGSEGLGKSWWIHRMSKGYTATLGRIDNKDTLIVMQRAWIMVADEGHSLRKADADEQKEFLTRTEDVFRLPYEREAQAHKRHGVIWSTTNDEVFLRRQEGNRRFLIVTCEDKVDFDLLTDHYVDQVWAEAMHMYRSGELLYLADDEGAVAAAEREHFTEEDALGGVLKEFLDTRVPENWTTMSADARAQWVEDRRGGFVPEGTVRQITTCSAQLWVEALGRRFGDHKRTDLLEITTAMKRLPEWKTLRGRQRIPGYGPQLVFVRTTDEDGEDLI